MSRFNSPLLALIALAAFLWLAYESRQEIGYSHSVFDVLSLAQRQAAAIREVFGLTEATYDLPEDWN